MLIKYGQNFVNRKRRRKKCSSPTVSIFSDVDLILQTTLAEDASKVCLVRPLSSSHENGANLTFYFFSVIEFLCMIQRV